MKGSGWRSSQGKEDEDRKDKKESELGVSWTLVYYAVLVAGAFAWWKSLWVLTKSEGALMKFGI